MARIIGNKDEINSLVEEALPILRDFASFEEDVLYTDYTENELHTVLALRDAIHLSTNLKDVEQILKTPVHEASLKGYLFLALEKIGLSGLSDNLEKVLKKFNTTLLAGAEPRQEFLPPGFRIIEEKAQTKQPDSTAKNAKKFVDEFGEGVGVVNTKKHKTAEVPVRKAVLQR